MISDRKMAKISTISPRSGNSVSVIHFNTVIHLENEIMKQKSLVMFNVNRVTAVYPRYTSVT